MYIYISNLQAVYICGYMRGLACKRLLLLSFTNEAASYMVMLGSQHLFVVAFRPQRHPIQIEPEFRHVRLVALVILIIFMF